MSIARSTPAQKPRGPARTICCNAGVVMRPSLEEVRDAEHARVEVEPPIRLRRVPVRDVLEAIAEVHRDPVGHEVGQPGPALEHEGERRVDLRAPQPAAPRARRRVPPAPAVTARWGTSRPSPMKW